MDMDIQYPTISKKELLARFDKASKALRELNNGISIMAGSDTWFTSDVPTDKINLVLNLASETKSLVPYL